jgi:hypothetical protein
MEYLDNFKKQRSLFIFKQLLRLYDATFIVLDPVYDNTQPSKSTEKTIFNIIFQDSMLKLVPHTVDGTMLDFKSTVKTMVNVVVGRLLPISTYKFVNELDYINIMKSVDFKVEPRTLSSRQLFNSQLDIYYGYGLVSKKENKYVIDTQYLKTFEIRKGYSNLDCIVYLNDKLQFEYCEINGVKRLDDLAIRECITAMTTIGTIEKHLFEIHLLISDKFNSFLNQMNKSNTIYRLLIPVTNDPYSINEFGSISLLGKRGICSFYNLTRKGLKQYYKYTKQNFKIRDLLIPKDIKGDSTIHAHQHLWFNCIRNFVSEFLSIQPDLQCNDFLDVLKDSYSGIYDETKSKLENVIDICAMMLYSNIMHECYSNSSRNKLVMNPYIVSSTWKKNNSSNVSDKINTLSEQITINLLAYATSLEAIRMDDKRWINICCVNKEEKRIYKKYRNSISKLDIHENAILHPKNISSSVSY